jgi:NitT/TauT family transport system substrate-binding protein
MKKTIIIMITGLLLMAACHQSYEETKRQMRMSQKEVQRRDSAALKVAVMPTLDCLPLFVAEHYQLFDTLRGGVRLKPYMAQMDCDTALERGRVEGMVTDLVRAKRLEMRGMKLRYPTVTNAHWQLVVNRNARVRQLKQLDDKMVAMTRFSALDLLTDRVIDSVKLNRDRVYKVQINDLSVRLLMLQNNEMDALLLTEPQAAQARLLKHKVLLDTRSLDMKMGAVVMRNKEMNERNRKRQLDVMIKGYNDACDSINKNGVAAYSDLVMKYCKVKKNTVESLKDIKFEKISVPRQQDIECARKWLSKK